MIRISITLLIELLLLFLGEIFLNNSSKFISFKENIRDLEIYNFLNEVIKDEIGISTYIKMLISEDMKKRNA